jgi:DNA-binding transcriptional LysR family regulator
MEAGSQAFIVDVRRLRVLRELAERHTITATAEALHLTPSAVSQQIAALAREAGVPLLARNGRGVQLTDQARILLGHAANVHTELERAQADLAAYSQGEVGMVSIGAFGTAISGLVAPALRSLRKERPRLTVRVAETEPPACFTRLDSGDLDLVITVDWRHAPYRGDPRYYRHDLLRDPFLVALPAHHPKAVLSSLQLADLADEVWISGNERSPCVEVAVAACLAAGFNPKIGHRVEDWAAVIELVAASAGIALIPRMAAHHPSTSVTLRHLRPDTPGRNLYAAMRAGSERSLLLRPVLSALDQASTTRVSRSSPVGL